MVVIDQQKAEEADYNLSPSRWVNCSSDVSSADLGKLLQRFETLLATESQIEHELIKALAKLKALA